MVRGEPEPPTSPPTYEPPATGLDTFELVIEPLEL